MLLSSTLIRNLTSHLIIYGGACRLVRVLAARKSKEREDLLAALAIALLAIGILLRAARARF